MMLKNYFTIALRLFTRRKVYSLINTLGLGIAIAFSLLVFLFIHDEQAFDQFHQEKERTYLLKEWLWFADKCMSILYENTWKS